MRAGAGVRFRCGNRVIFAFQKELKQRINEGDVVAQTPGETLGVSQTPSSSQARHTSVQSTAVVCTHSSLVSKRFHRHVLHVTCS